MPLIYFGSLTNHTMSQPPMVGSASGAGGPSEAIVTGISQSAADDKSKGKKMSLLATSNV